MRFGILVAVLFSSTIGLMPSTVAQITPQEQEKQPPPPSATGSSPRESRAGMPESSSEPVSGMAEMEELMQGPSPGMSMSQMMRGPTSTEFYPTLISISELALYEIGTSKFGHFRRSIPSPWSPL